MQTLISIETKRKRLTQHLKNTPILSNIPDTASRPREKRRIDTDYDNSFTAYVKIWNLVTTAQ